MQFRDCLIILNNSFSDREFDSKILSEFIRKYLQRYGYAHLIEKFSIKRISSDLDRLHRMGFLAARRVKRQVMTKTGIRCNKGYNYMYSITSQGRQYYNYLLNPEEAYRRNKTKIRQKQEDSQALLGITPSLTRFPPELADVEELYKENQARSTKAGRFNRFPNINGDSIIMKYILAKQFIFDMTDNAEERQTILSKLESIARGASGIIQSSTENRRQNTLLNSESEYHYLYGLLSWRFS